MTYAKIIADSITERGDRVTTLEVQFHRFVLAEFNTHRVFSRNSASSRAIPVRKQLERIEANPALPVAWPAEQKGMQGGDELDSETHEACMYEWYLAAAAAKQAVEQLQLMGLHKSVSNRLLEPFMWHTVVVTATAWENFFAQRCSPLAQPEIRVAAEMMRTAYEASDPKLITRLDQGWHLPYIQDSDLNELMNLYDPPTAIKMAVEISSARCARTSYLTQDGVRDLQEDLQLYKRLVTASPMHGSPLEHACQPDLTNQQWVDISREEDPPHWVNLPRYGNLLGWRQHRFDVEAAQGYGAFS